jgi:hypothetical protein
MAKTEYRIDVQFIDIVPLAQTAGYFCFLKTTGEKITRHILIEKKSNKRKQTTNKIKTCTVSRQLDTIATKGTH